MNWCIPSNITALIEQNKEKLEHILGSKVNELPDAVKNIELIAEIEGVSSMQ